MEKDREMLLARHAMWIGDYEAAYRFYKEIATPDDSLDPLSKYAINFDLAVIGTILKKDSLAKESIEKLEKSLRDSEEADDRIQENTEKSFESIQASTIRRFVFSKHFDRKQIGNMLREYFPSEKGVLALFVSPRYARSSLRNSIRYAKKGKVPEILEAGIFRYSLSSELYRVVCRAYCVVELDLEKLDNFKSVKILTRNPNAYYLEDKELSIIAGVYREGLVVCYYLVENSEDTSGAIRIHNFLEALSEVFLADK